MTFATGSALNAPPKVCPHLGKSTTSVGGYYCGSAKKCEYLDSISECPIIELARTLEVYYQTHKYEKQ